MDWLRRLHRRTLSPRLSIWLTTAIVLFVTIWGVPYTVNRPRLQQAVLRLVNHWSNWHVSVGRVTWSPWSASVILDDLRIGNETSGHEITATTLQWRYRPLTLLRGVARISAVHGSDISIQLQHMQASDSGKPRPNLSLRQFLLLDHIQFDDIDLQRVALLLPNNLRTDIAAVRLQYQPGWIGRATVKVRLINTVLQRPNSDPVTIQRLTMGGESTIANWLQHAPYINDLEGTLRADHITWRSVVTQRVTAVTSIADGRITLNDLRVRAYDRALRGDGHLEFGTRDSALTLEWPEPVPIPELLPDTSFWRTASTLQGRVAWKGRIPTVLTPTGTLDIDVTQIPTAITDVPAKLTAVAHWNDGVMTLERGDLRVGDGAAAITGTVDLPNRVVDLSARATHVSLPGVLGRFRSVYYHPIAGEADCQARFKGWARDYTLDVTATARALAYQGIAVEQADLKMQLTYPQLTLRTTITQQGRQSGVADLKVAFGAKPADGGPRPSTMHLTATITDHPLAQSFALYGLSGVGSGQLRVDGSPTDYRGTGSVTLQRGATYSIPFESITSAVQLRPQELTLSNLQLQFPELPKAHWPGALRLAIRDGFRMAGTPAPGVRADLAYDSRGKRWTFTDVTWADPGTTHRLTMRGTGRTGAWDLHFLGTANAAWAALFPAYIRDASGDLPLDLHMRGDFDRPIFSGRMTLQQNNVTLRALPYEWERVTGTLQIADNRIQCHNVRGLVGDGHFALGGWASFTPTGFDRYQLSFDSTTLPWTSDDHTIHAELDTKFAITRVDGNHTTVSGLLDIGSATYRRDFSILGQGANERLIAREKFRQLEAGWDHIRLALDVRSHGDVEIHNNVATIALRIHARLVGSLATPIMLGSIDTTEGELHYLGLQFQLTHGTINFPALSAEPFLEFTGEETIGSHRVQIVLRGPTDNLHVDLSSIPGEDHKNVLCLIGYGVTCDQLRSTQGFAAKLGPNVLAEQIARVLERPIRKATGLDIVQLESAVGTSDLTKLHIGKQVSDRIELGFVTTVGQNVTDQSVEVGYKVSDNLLLKAAQSAGNATEVKISVRLRER